MKFSKESHDPMPSHVDTYLKSGWVLADFLHKQLGVKSLFRGTCNFRSVLASITTCAVHVYYKHLTLRKWASSTSSSKEFETITSTILILLNFMTDLALLSLFSFSTLLKLKSEPPCRQVANEEKIIMQRLCLFAKLCFSCLYFILYIWGYSKPLLPSSRKKKIVCAAFKKTLTNYISKERLSNSELDKITFAFATCFP